MWAWHGMVKGIDSATIRGWLGYASDLHVLDTHTHDCCSLSFGGCILFFVAVHQWERREAHDAALGDGAVARVTHDGCQGRRRDGFPNHDVDGDGCPGWV